jgi:hypothetical protein
MISVLCVPCLAYLVWRTSFVLLPPSQVLFPKASNRIIFLVYEALPADSKGRLADEKAGRSLSIGRASNGKKEPS